MEPRGDRLSLSGDSIAGRGRRARRLRLAVLEFGVPARNMLQPMRMKTLALSAVGVIAASAAFGAAAVTPAWTPIGPESGVINFVAVAPSDVTRVYAASPTGGVFRSDDSAVTWRSASQGLTTLQIRCLAVAPANPDVVYAGSTAGAFQSTDGGAHWTAFGGGFPSAVITSIAVDPTNPSTLYAAGTTGTLVKSTNAGASWSPIGGATIASSQPRTLALDLVHSGTVYLGTIQDGFYRSDDGGSSFTLHNDGFLQINPAVVAIAADPTNASGVYAGAVNDVYVSTDKGDDWLPVEVAGFPTAIQGVAVDASGAAYTADQLGFYTRAAGAAAWTQVVGSPSWITSISVGTGDAPPAFIADGKTAYSPGGVERWDGGNELAHSAPTAETITALAADPAHPGRLLAGAAFGIVATEGGGVTDWQQVACCTGNIFGNIATAILFDARTPELVYLSTGAGIFRSTDGGLTYTTSSAGLASVVRSLLAQPGSATGLLAGATNGLYQSSDGANWSPGSADLSGRIVLALSQDPASPSSLWAGTDDGAYHSTDGGQHWAKAGSLGGNVHAVLAAGPRVLAGTDTGLSYSGNGGSTWSAGSGISAAVNALAGNAGSGVAYAGTTAGVLQSTDGGATWSTVATGLTDPTVLSLALAPDGTLAAGTDGGSVFRFQDVQTAPRGGVDRVGTLPPPRAVPPRP